MINKVIIDPRSSFQYGSFYIKALKDLVGWRRISFKIDPFISLGDLDKDMRFIVIQNGCETKYFIHTNDCYKISQEDYDWCDVYGCVNANYANYPRDEFAKLISLCPSFAIRPGNLMFCLYVAFSCFCSAFSYIAVRKEWSLQQNTYVINKKRNLKLFWTRFYRGVTQRFSLQYYNPKSSTNAYVFFLSTLWYSDEWNRNDEGVNLRRANFIRACKSLEKKGILSFEGGFANRSYSSSQKLFADCMGDSIPMTEWLSKTKESCVVFNTPAFWNCHGWKLGEYLALGKCIVSTPLNNDLPEPLVHGENIYFVEDTVDSIREAISFLVEHPEYRKKIEEGSRRYWTKYGTPKSSLRLLGLC